MPGGGEGRGDKDTHSVLAWRFCSVHELVSGAICDFSK